MILQQRALTKGNVKKLEIPEGPISQDTNVPRAVVRGVHLNSSGLGFCRMSDAIKGASELREKAEGLGLTDAARSITEAISAVEKAIPAARDPGIGATTAEARRRALSREAAASFIVEAAKSSIQAGESVLVAGDFNTAVSEPCKTGADLDRDFEGIIGCSTILKAEQCSGDDGYDDTYHIFTSGDDGRPAFEITTKNLGKTYAKGEFADSPIDNVLVAGPFKEKAFTATKFGRPDDQQAVFGSDHHAVGVKFD